MSLQQAAELDKYQQDLRDLENTFGPDENHAAPKVAETRAAVATLAAAVTSQEISGVAEDAFTQMIASQRVTEMFPDTFATQTVLASMKLMFMDFLKAKAPQEKERAAESGAQAYGPAPAAGAARPSPLLPGGVAFNHLWENAGADGPED